MSVRSTKQADLSVAHKPLSDLFPLPQTRVASAAYSLQPEQIAFFQEHGYLAGLKLLDDHQIERLRAELRELMNPTHPLRRLFYEYHTNESGDPAGVLFHALGAWRIARGFHDLLWHPGFTMPAAQLLDGAV